MRTTWNVLTYHRWYVYHSLETPALRASILYLVFKTYTMNNAMTCIEIYYIIKNAKKEYVAHSKARISGVFYMYLPDVTSDQTFMTSKLVNQPTIIPFIARIPFKRFRSSLFKNKAE